MKLVDVLVREQIKEKVKERLQELTDTKTKKKVKAKLIELNKLARAKHQRVGNEWVTVQPEKQIKNIQLIEHEEGYLIKYHVLMGYDDLGFAKSPILRPESIFIEKRKPNILVRKWIEWKVRLREKMKEYSLSL